MYAVINLECVGGAQVCNIPAHAALAAFELVDRFRGHVSVCCNISIHTRHAFIKGCLEFWVTLAGAVSGYFGSHRG